MRVAAFLYAYPPDRVAGADLMSQSLLEALRDAGHDVHVFTSALIPDSVRDGIRVVRRTRFRKGDWDLIYSHPDLGAEAHTWAQRLGVPYVGVVHNTSPKTTRWLHQHPPTLTVWNSYSTRAAHRGEGGLVCRSPLTVADHRVSPTGDAITLVNLCAAKGGEVFWSLARAMPDRPFLGVRGGWGVQQDKHPTRNATIVGPLPHPRMGEVWARTRVLVMPSEAESWGRAALEAACSGIPTIAHPTPGLQEALGDAGIWADRDRPGEWVEAMNVLGNPAVYAARSRQAAARAREVEAATAEDLARFVAAVGSLSTSGGVAILTGPAT